MRRGVAVGSFVLGAALAGAITLVAQPAPDDDVARPAGGAVGGVSAGRQAPADAAAAQTRRWVADSLARPLFTPDRRPLAQAQAQSDKFSGLPRLSGIMITPTGRRAIFAATGRGKSDVVAEGGRVGSYLVQSISIGEVVLIGPDGRHSLHPTFDRAFPAMTIVPPVVSYQAPARRAEP